MCYIIGNKTLHASEYAHPARFFLYINRIILCQNQNTKSQFLHKSAKTHLSKIRFQQENTSTYKNIAKTTISDNRITQSMEATVSKSDEYYANIKKHIFATKMCFFYIFLLYIIFRLTTLCYCDKILL